MPSFRIEPHAHTNIVSPCGRLSPEELVAGHLEAGYSGLVITDHLVPWTPILEGAQTWSDAVHRFFSGYRATLEAAANTDLVVLPGFELSFTQVPGSDFLVFGLDESSLQEIPEPFFLPPERFLEQAHSLGGLMVQAHPFRGSGPLEPDLLDGIEVFNGNPRHESRNDLAQTFATRHSLLELSGSDVHWPGDIGRGGIEMPFLPRTSGEFSEALKKSADQIRLLIPDPIA